MRIRAGAFHQVRYEHPHHLAEDCPCGNPQLNLLYGNLHLAAACEQSNSLALGQNALRCRWQIKQSVLCAAVEKIKEQRKPEDFFGHRKPAAQPKMPLISNPVIRNRKAKSGKALGFWIYGSVYSPSIYTVSAPMADAPVTSSAALIPNMKIR